MTEITLSRALSIKKRLAGDVDRLGKLLIGANYWRSENTPQYEAKELHEKLALTNQKLVAIKTAIAKANAPIQSKIFELAEKKGYIQVLRQIEVKEGKHHIETRRYSDNSVELEYVSAFSRKELDKMISDVQDEIDEIQAELDAFNANNKILWE